MRDPVHGDIELTQEEVRLVDTAEFQRLRGIKQLGTAYLVFHGATHSRFEHSVGTVHMTQRLLDAVNKNAARDPAGCARVSPEEQRILRAAALLHDVTHIPFGHNIEDQTGLLPRHDVPERFASVLGDTELGAALDALGMRREVLAVLTGEGLEVPSFWRQVLSDTIDSDLMDYLRRDAYYTGLELRYDLRVADYFRVDRGSQRMFVDCEKQGMLREDVLSELVRMLETRYHFSERVYYHHAKIAAGALIARMVELAFRGGELAAADLQGATDQSLLDALTRIGRANGDGRLRRFADRFARRELPKRVLVLPAALNASVQEELLDRYCAAGRPDERLAWEAGLEQRAAAEFGRPVDVLMYAPARSMQLKEARTLVRLPGSGGIRPLADFGADVPRLHDLAASYPRLWKFYVLTSERDRAARRRLQQMCLEALPAGCVNALRV
ncbi:MAG: HD domain-containing protein [Planctomycetota bacterium]